MVWVCIGALLGIGPVKLEIPGLFWEE